MSRGLDVGFLGAVDPQPATGGGGSGGASKKALLALYKAGTSTFVAPAAGSYTFYAYGAAGDARPTVGGVPYGSASGAVGKITKTLAANDTVQIVVGVGGGGLTSVNENPTGGVAGGNTTLTFTDGTVATAPGSPWANTSRTGPTATGFDVNLKGGNGDTGSGGTTPAIDVFPAFAGGLCVYTNNNLAMAGGKSGEGFGAGAGGAQAAGSNSYAFTPNGRDGAVLVFG